MITILIVDDVELILDGVETHLRTLPQIGKIYRATEGQAALEIIKNNPIDLLLIDIEMPDGIGGIETIRQLRKLKLDVKIIVFSQHRDLGSFHQLLRLDVKVIVEKIRVKQDLEKAINFALNNAEFYTPDIQAILNEQHRLKNKREHIRKIDQLTPRQQELIPYLAKGIKLSEIAKKFGISENTVKTHRREIYDRLYVHNAAALTYWATQNGFD